MGNGGNPGRARRARSSREGSASKDSRDSAVHAVPDHLDRVGEDEPEVFPLGLEVVGKDVPGSVGSRVEIGRLAVVVPALRDHDVADVVPGVDGPGDSGEEHVGNAELVQSPLGVHRRVHHAHAAGEEQQVVAREPDVTEDQAVDVPGGPRGPGPAEDALVGLDFRRIGRHDRDERSGPVDPGPGARRRSATGSDEEQQEQGQGSLHHR